MYQYLVLVSRYACVLWGPPESPTRFVFRRFKVAGTKLHNAPFRKYSPFWLSQKLGVKVPGEWYVQTVVLVPCTGTGTQYNALLLRKVLVLQCASRTSDIYRFIQEKDQRRVSILNNCEYRHRNGHQQESKQQIFIESLKKR